MNILGWFFRFIGIALSAVLLAGAALLIFAMVPQLGNKALIVRSGSMMPAINVGDLVVIRPRDSGYEAGEVIAYKNPANEEITVTHRVARRFPTTTGYEYVTKGDANEQEDAYRVPDSAVLGRQLMVIPYVGRFLALGKTKIGFISLVVVPTLLIIAGDGIVLWRGFRKKRGVKELKRGKPRAGASNPDQGTSRVDGITKRSRKIGQVPNKKARKRVRLDGITRN